MKYLVVGPTIINDIIFADQSRKDQVLGGSIFCVAGIKLWCDDCLYLSNVGEDFDRFYGDWMRANGCSTAGLRYILPHTWYTTLTYGDQGLHSEVSIYGPEEEALLETLDTIDPAHIAAHCGEDTRGRSPLGPPGRGARRRKAGEIHVGNPHLRHHGPGQSSQGAGNHPKSGHLLPQPARGHEPVSG